MRLHDLSPLILQHVAHRAVQHAGGAAAHRSRVMAIETFASGLDTDQDH